MVSVPFPGVKPLDNLPACRRLLPSSAVDHVRPEDDRTRRAGSQPFDTPLCPIRCLRRLVQRMPLTNKLVRSLRNWLGPW